MLSSSMVRLTASRSFSYLHQVGKDPLKYVTVGQLFENNAKVFSDRDAIISVHQKKKFTYGEVFKKCDQLAASFLNIGLKKGDRVGLWCPNFIEWFIVKYACARAGLILVGLNPNYQIPEVEYSINKVQLKCLICPDKVKNVPYYEMLNTLIPNLERSEPGKLNASTVPSLKSVITISEEALKGTYNYQEIAGFCEESAIRKISENQNCISPDDAFTILFSSGSTGKPKAAVVSHFSHANNSMHIGRNMELNIKPHKICVMVPFFHAFGLTISTGSSVAHGSTIVLPSSTYSPSSNLRAIQEEKCTIIHGTPTMHLDLINEQRKKKTNVSAEIAVSGGSPISQHQFKTMLKEFKLKSVKSVYGLTETTSVVFASKPGDDEEKSTTTVGCLVDHTEVKTIDSEGKVVPFGTAGELCIRGYSNMIGYWDDKEKTEATLGTDGWLKTGDQFILTEDGYGRIVGRLKDMIIRGGENIFPREIEDILITHSDIAEVYIIGVPNERLGEEVCAYVRLKENSELTLKQMADFCKGKMANYKIPSHMKVVNSFPKTATGKVQKFILQQEFVKNYL